VCIESFWSLAQPLRCLAFRDQEVRPLAHPAPAHITDHPDYCEIMNPTPNTFEEACAFYTNTAEVNDGLHAAFTAQMRKEALLAGHRHYIEENNLGFGDPAFHYMWKLLVTYVAEVPQPRFLEIGVYKGQVLSLWALLAKELGLDADLYAISPMRGSPQPGPWVTRLLCALSQRFRDRLGNGDFYDHADYLTEARNLFRHFCLDWNSVHLLRGLSQDPEIRRAAAQHTYNLIYVDGDHTYEGARADFEFYGGLLSPRGLLVADDSGVSLPGSTFWKGHPSVSKAADEVLPRLGLTNILNIGHNRVFQRLA